MGCHASHDGDADAAAVIQNVFVRGGMTILSKSRMQSVERAGDGVVVTLSDGRTVHVAGIMEHIEEAGVHSGDSACSLPPHTLDAADHDTWSAGSFFTNPVVAPELADEVARAVRLRDAAGAERAMRAIIDESAAAVAEDSGSD